MQRGKPTARVVQLEEGEAMTPDTSGDFPQQATRGLGSLLSTSLYPYPEPASLLELPKI